MGILDVQTYVLKDQRELPREQQIRWTYHLPTFGDTLAVQREAKREADPELSAQVFGVARIAACLERTAGVRRGGEPAEIDPALPLPERVAWVMRLPASWVVELAAAIAEESDLDPEEE